MKIAELTSRSIVGTEVYETLRNAAVLLAANEVGALLVYSPRGPVGILSERDLIRAVADGVDFGETRVRDYMSISPVRIEHNAPLEEGIAKMSDLGVRHLVVVHQAELVGIVSARDILRALKGKNLGSNPETKGLRTNSLKLVNPC